MIADDTHGFTETLEVNDLTGTQEADRIYNIGIFYHTKNIIIAQDIRDMVNLIREEVE